MTTYEVIVGNVGSVLEPDADEQEAHTAFEHYAKLSDEGYGRCAGESVVLFEDDEPIRKYDPRTRGL